MMKRTIRIFLFVFIFLSHACSFSYKKDVYSGTLELTEYALGARVPGRISTLTVDEGSTVSKGGLIATLDRYEQAKKDFERSNALFEHGGVSAQTIEQAKLAMDDQAIYSPVEGVVLNKMHEVGEILGAGTPVVVVGESAKPWVRIFVPEGVINKVKLNQPATLRFDGLGKTFKGHVIFIASQAEFTPRNVQTPEERITQSFAVKVILDEAFGEVHPGVATDVTLGENTPP